VIFSKTQEYAIQALVHLAQTPTTYRLNRDVAAALDVPAPYLAKVLKRFAQEGLLESAKGRGGGYRIRKRALSASIRSVVEIADGNPPVSGCLIGLSRCTDQTACPVHQKWLPLRDRITALLDRQTVADLASKASAAKSTGARRTGAAARTASAKQARSRRK
jgi:Rrf2 family transcriptional regulator, iron-sulfur cluster assembly transcription factor